MNCFFIITAVLFTLQTANAQNPDNISEQTMSYENMATSSTANIIGQNDSDGYYQWQKFIEGHKGNTYLVSPKEENVECESEHIELPVLDERPVTLHSRFAPNYGENGVLLTWTALADGSYYPQRPKKIPPKRLGIGCRGLINICTVIFCGIDAKGKIWSQDLIP